MSQPILKNLGSLITYELNNVEYALGYLFDFTGRGVYDANYGKVEVSPEHAKAHNTALDEAQLEGLDKNCEVGQRGTFYYVNREKGVTTWMGTVVAEPRRVEVNGNSLTFRRNGKTYRGRLQKDADCFNFKRVAILLVFISLAMAGGAQELPSAPTPHNHPIGRLEASLLAADAAVRLGDGVTTYRFLSDPCRCYHEIDPIAPHSANAAKIAAFQVASWGGVAVGERWLRRRGHSRLALALQVGDIAMEGYWVQSNARLVQHAPK
jgi:hypothetical protein